MEFILAIFQAFAAAKDVVEVSGSVSDWVLGQVERWSKVASTDTIEKEVQKIAAVTDEQIRGADAKVFARGNKSNASKDQREELIGVLLNLTRNVRYRSAFGSMSGSFLRSERLLDLLLSGVEPVRHQNEPVAAGSPWILRRHLGMGSFGEVWMAENPGIPIRRAYKFFTKDHSGEWLRREQKGLVAILNRLQQHDHIVQFIDVQTEKCQYPYLALEYLGGGSLEEWIVKDAKHRVGLEPREIIRQIVDGLAAAHAKQIFHRDIKPANILLTEGRDVRIKIGDFGLAKVSGAKRGMESQLASLAGVVGTALYWPPESQQRGVKRKPSQDDVFALGVVWYQLIMGTIERPPYDFAERLRSKELDSRTINLIERCLAHPARRFIDAQEVQAAIIDNDEIPPLGDPPAGMPDLQYIAREFLLTAS